MRFAHRSVLPVPVRSLNTFGKTLNLVGVHPHRLTVKRLLRSAQRRTGLSDFGPDSFREGLEVLVRSLETEAQLTLFGRIIAENDILQLLENRLRLVHAFEQEPDLSGRPIKRPVFVLGLPRSGTSIMHELLAQDPASRVPLSWETKYPFPAPRTETYRTDARIAKVAKELQAVDRLLPEFKKMHPMGAEFPQECVLITALNFASMIFDTSYRVPSYQHWLDTEADWRSAYDLHYQFLQHLQWRHPAERWVLKSPGHLWTLDALLDRYPDALIIHLHRDPLKVLSSVTSLIATLRTLVAEKVDMHEIAERQAKIIADGLTRATTVRDSKRLSSAQVVDLNFTDFIADPIGKVSAIYQQFGFEFGNSAEALMRRFLKENPADKYGKHHYRFIDTGLSLEGERKRFRAYQARFNVPSERV